MTRRKSDSNIDWFVFITTAVVIVAVALFLMVAPDRGAAAVDSTFRLITNEFGIVYVWASRLVKRRRLLGGYSIRDTRYRILDTGCWIPDTRYGILGTGSIAILSYPASRIQHPVSRIPHPESRILHPVCRIGSLLRNISYLNIRNACRSISEGSKYTCPSASTPR